MEESLPDFCAATTPEARAALAEAQLTALAAAEPKVRAFVCHDVDAARRDLERRPDGPLAGALFAVKDIIATADFPTRYGADDPDAPLGSPTDAWCVAEARRHGGTLLGKTVCTAFAFPRPGPTTNPHDPARTPGGSSSGSAAAVAAGFVSFALGTQTAGSTIRPASYCGVVGFKPSYGLFPTDGIQAISTTCDHLGLFARSPRDAWYVASAMLFGHGEILAPQPPRRVLLLRLPPGIPHGNAYPERLAALGAELARFGVIVEGIDLPVPLDDFRRLQQEICYWEAARLLLASPTIRPLPELRALLEPYLAMDVGAYGEWRRRREAYQRQFATLFDGYDAVLLPAATGVAPDRAGTGDAIMSRFWTALHFPAVTIPFWRSEEGLPLGLQLLAPLGMDRELLATAEWFHRAAIGR